MIDSLRQDIRYAFRTLARVPAFTFAAVATLGIGIGATALVFSMVNTMLLRPFPYSDPDRLVIVEEIDNDRGNERVGTSYPNFLSWRNNVRSFSSISAYDDRSVSLRVGEDAEQLEGTRVSANLFQTLGIEPILGRAFVPAEDAPGGPRAVILSHTQWMRHFNGARDVIGRTVQVDAEPHTVVGIMPPDFAFPARSQVWVPFRLGAAEDRGARYLNTVARLGDGVTVELAQQELQAVSAQLASAYPGPNGGHAASVENMQAATTRQVRPILLILLGAVGFVLLIACANVANLMLARAATRDREMAIRSAVGAAGNRLVRQLLTESLIIALLGGIVGVLAGAWWLDLFLRGMPEEAPAWMVFGIDRTVLLFVAAVAVTTSVVFGMAPALQARRADLQSTLKEGRASSSTRRVRLRSVFVVSQIAAAMVLLVGATLMLRSFLAMRAVDPGFDRTNVVTMDVSVPSAKYEDNTRLSSLYDRVIAELASLPDVERVAAVSWFPVSGSTRMSNFSVEGVGEVQGSNVYNESVTPEYFAAMGIPIERGRAFDDRDRAGAPAVVIINKHFAERFFPGTNPVGRRVMVGAGDGPYATVVGVVGNVNERDINQKETGLDMYAPMAQAPDNNAALVLRTRSGSAAALATVRDRMRRIDPDIAIYDARTVETVIEEATWDARLTGSLFTLFGLGALLLAGIGLYGVIAYTVSQRTHEIGVRVALGASRTNVIGMVVSQGAKLTAIGLGIGIVIAFALSRVLSSLLFGVSTTDPYTFAAVPLLLGAVALLASYLPARRATRVNPITALRTD